jgi:hypothetical protein
MGSAETPEVEILGAAAVDVRPRIGLDLALVSTTMKPRAPLRATHVAIDAIDARPRVGLDGKQRLRRTTGCARQQSMRDLALVSTEADHALAAGVVEARLEIYGAW